ncbi:Endoribonuclease YbeY [Chlamydiales bacterium SCGC AG-110-P3]|nr:Endoribonuclease YbeY [Chlamydiales bacterium SCGC AG-110-P3]
MPDPVIPINHMQIHIGINDRQNTLDIDPDAVRKTVVLTLKQEGVHADELEIHFVTTKEICDLHSEYFDDPSSTDCITLPIDPPNTIPYCLLGEVFVCPETAIEYANNHGTDPYQETTLYVVHCILHLLGYTDTEPDAITAMRAAEKRIINTLVSHNAMIHAKTKEAQ